MWRIGENRHFFALFVRGRTRPPRCYLDVRIRLLVTRRPAVGGDPADRHLVVSGKDPVTDLHRRNGEALAWTKGIGSHSVDGGSGIDQNGVTVTALLAPVYDSKRLVDGKRLRIEYLLVHPEVEAASGPAATDR